MLILPRANLALELSSQVDWNSVGQSRDGRPRDSARYADTSPCDSSSQQRQQFAAAAAASSSSSSSTSQQQQQQRQQQQRQQPAAAAAAAAATAAVTRSAAVMISCAEDQRTIICINLRLQRKSSQVSGSSRGHSHIIALGSEGRGYYRSGQVAYVVDGLVHADVELLLCV